MPRCFSTIAIRSSWAALGIATTILRAQPAAAQTPDAPLSPAQQLFDHARELMEHSQFAEACPQLMTSFQLDPATGTLLNLAYCFEKQGKTASAYHAYKHAIARSAQEGSLERQQLAEARVALLESTLVQLALLLPTPMPGLWITLDGTGLDTTHLDATIPIDPGKHLLKYGAPHKLPMTLTVNARSSDETLLIEIRPLQPLPPANSDLVVKHAAPAHLPEVHSIPWVGAGIGLGIAATGAIATAYFGLYAKSEWDERNRLCASGCTESARQAGQRADHYAWAANGSAGVALVGAGVGAYLLLRSRSSTPRSESVSWIPIIHRQGAEVTAAIAF